MKILFYLGLGTLVLFEFLKIYFIMPFPGSQQWDSIDFAYFLYQFRWMFRITSLILILAGIPFVVFGKRKWVPILCLLTTLGMTAIFNLKMAADAMFKEPNQLSFHTRESFELNDSTLVVAIENEGEAKAYPIRYLVYHHQVRDTLAGQPVMITYCSVCRTGRVFLPFVDGKPEQFRLVGMDHFNAMFEDSATGSWWQQATGSAITGKLKGKKLDEIESIQLTAGAFFKAYPTGKIMAADPDFLSKYDTLGKFEKGKSESKLTGTDPFSWNEKSWVVGIRYGGRSKAFDWNELQEKKIIQDQVGEESVVIILASDSQSFVAFRQGSGEEFLWKNDTLRSSTGKVYSFTGKSLDDSGEDLERIPAYQEFWHSWKSFHPDSLGPEH
ncbi:MAG: DUF3179 domain-containing (seleno)protein [Algoriphagus sp.]|nr:DUF3179 domain-containing (seleno)protein [Algoriphagus sp.]